MEERCGNHCCRVSRLRIAPPLIISRELIGTALPIVKEAIKEAKKDI